MYNTYLIGRRRAVDADGGAIDLLQVQAGGGAKVPRHGYQAAAWGRHEQV